MDSARACNHCRPAQMLVIGLLWLAAVTPANAQQGRSSPSDENEQHARRMAQGMELFKREVRPLLSERCLVCHGGAQSLGGFDLSNRESLVKSGKLGASAGSRRLLKLIRHEQEPHMPFQQPKLPEQAINNIARWIELGAPYDKPLIEKSAGGQPAEVTEADRQFWSFQPLACSEPPAGDRGWSRTPIDRFILQKLHEKGLTPNPEADRRALIRRAFLDLLGLPPDSEEVDAFVRDRSPDAYEKRIDRLLASRHFGERWARHWIDIARFAESYGFERDYERPYAYHYRDFLIKAFNRDMPYDRFVRWQLAGDELAPDNPLALMATGFLGAGAFPTEITEREFETVRYDELDDMVNTTGTAMLGLTIGCARCHDHKYDPIPTRDYYRLASVFGHTIRTEIDYDPVPDASRAALAQWEAEHKELVAARSEYERRRLADPFARWLENAPGLPSDDPWRVLDFTEYQSKQGATLEKLEDGSILAGSEIPDLDEYTFTADVQARNIRTLRVEALTHPSFPHNGPGRSRGGRFLLTSLKATAQPLADPDAEPVKLKFVSTWTTGPPDPAAAPPAVSGANVADRGWRPSAESTGRDQAAAFALAEPVGFEGGARLTIKLHFGKHIQCSLGRTRISISGKPRPPLFVGSGVPQPVVEGMDVVGREGPSGLSEPQRTALLRFFARSDAGWRQRDQAVQSHLFSRPVPTKTKIQVTSEGYPIPRHNSNGNGYPHFYKQTYFLKRGDVSQKEEPASPGFLRVLMPEGGDAKSWLAAAPRGWERTSFRRASLANWITDVERGAGALLARVIVNRLWHYHLGRGIVATPSDFGRQGDPPSHPALLDWLARDLIDHGWRLKRLHKLIMTSAVYRQSAAYDEEKAAADVNNVYRWRWTPRRLEAEAMRDSLLTVSGLLDRSMYGPGAMRSDMLRRSVYFFIKRANLIPVMMLFDWPEQLVGIGRRPSTTIAPQALMFLNSPQARSYAEGLARRLDGLQGRSAVQQAYRIAYGRTADADELAAAEEFLDRQRRSYANEGQVDASTLALTDYCQTLLGLSEFLYIR